MAQIVIFGAAGYSGLELMRWLAWHPEVEVVAASSDARDGELVEEAIPGGPVGLRFTSHVETLAGTEAGQIAFLATPALTAAELAPTLLERGLRVIDLSGGHRLPAEQYPEWYGFEHPFPSSLEEAWYGLPELTGIDGLAEARLVANPGCYATAAALAAAPLVRSGLLAEGATLVVDGKSGATGAGKSLKTPMLYSELADDVRPYRVGKHQHTPEIERTLAALGGSDPKVFFTAHLVPMRRGLLCSVYAPARSGLDAAAVSEAFQSLYADAPGVRLRASEPPETKRTAHQPHAEVWGHLDPRTGIVSAFGAIDNLVKGAAGQAIQNLNGMLGVPLLTGLTPSGR